MRPTLPALAFALACASCSDLDAFSTGEGEAYAGAIVDADYVRRGFPKRTTMRATFHVRDATCCPAMKADCARECTQGGPGALTTSDRTFDETPLEPVEALPQDSLSTMEFAGSRLRNYFFFVPFIAGERDGEAREAEALVVVSLVADDRIDVRVLGGADDLFGVFRLRK